MSRKMKPIRCKFCGKRLFNNLHPDNIHCKKTEGTVEGSDPDFSIKCPRCNGINLLYLSGRRILHVDEKERQEEHSVHGPHEAA